MGLVHNKIQKIQKISRNVPIANRIVLGLVLLLGIAASPIGSACELKVGWEPWPPYTFEAANGQISGLDSDLLSAIAAEMDCTLSWVQATWKRSLQRVESGEIDALMSAVFTEERAVWALYSNAYRQAANHLVVGKDFQGKYNSLKTFLDAGNKLGIVREYAYGERVMAMIGSDPYKNQIRDTMAANANMIRVASGRVDGVLMDAYVASSLKRELGVSDKIAATSIEVSSHDLHILFSKASVDPGIVDNFNAVLARLKTNGSLQKLFDKYSQ